MASQPGKKTIAIHILPNISRSKDDQAMKYGQLIQFSVYLLDAKLKAIQIY